MAYVLPLIFTVLNRNGIDEEKGEEEGEQVLLGLEFLSFHSSSCKFAPGRICVCVCVAFELTYKQFPIVAFLELKLFANYFRLCRDILNITS